jgi:AhpD family alkylhydroperoxidase
MNYIEERQRLEKRLLEFGKEHPGPMTGFARLHKKAVEAGMLDTKVKELMALAISIVVGCDGCIAYHIYNAVKAGAARQELIETLGVALMMGGGPGSIYVAHAMEAIEQILSNE